MPLTSLKRWKRKGALYAKAKPTKCTLHSGKKAKYAVAESLTAKWIHQCRAAGRIVTKQQVLAYMEKRNRQLANKIDTQKSSRSTASRRRHRFTARLIGGIK